MSSGEISFSSAEAASVEAVPASAALSCPELSSYPTAPAVSFAESASASEDVCASKAGASEAGLPEFPQPSAETSMAIDKPRHISFLNRIRISIPEHFARRRKGKPVSNSLIYGLWHVSGSLTCCKVFGIWALAFLSRHMWGFEIGGFPSAIWAGCGAPAQTAS